MGGVCGEPDVLEMKRCGKATELTSLKKNGEGL